MNTEIIVHPKLQHFGLTTANLDAMIELVPQSVGYDGQPSLSRANWRTERAVAFRGVA